jgi:hypothetical protein
LNEQKFVKQSEIHAPVERVSAIPGIKMGHRLYVQPMPGSSRKRQEKITFDALMQTASAEFANISDHLRANARYPSTDILVSAFAIVSLKSPSLLSFDERAKVESRNLKSHCRIEALPGHRQMPTALDSVGPTPLRPQRRAGFARESGMELLRRRPFSPLGTSAARLQALANRSQGHN